MAQDTRRLTKYDYETISWAMKIYLEHNEKITAGQLGKIGDNFTEYLQELQETLIKKADLDIDTQIATRYYR